MEKTIFVSFDVEADGPFPGSYSMLSFAAAGFTPEGKILATNEFN